MKLVTNAQSIEGIMKNFYIIQSLAEMALLLFDYTCTEICFMVNIVVTWTHGHE